LDYLKLVFRVDAGIASARAARKQCCDGWGGCHDRGRARRGEADAVMPLKIPRQVGFIVSTEACERFSYYGMLSILMLYLKNQLNLAEAGAKEVVHLFKMAVYFLPVAGALLADYVWGRYGTILSLSLFYCLGHATLALFEGQLWGIYAGLALIAIGAGGIKPCVSAFVGDQFAGDDHGLMPRVYGLFYWAVNLGAMFAFALIPLVRDHAGYRWAFGVPGLFMGLATLVFWLGSPQYIKREPARRAHREEASGKSLEDGWRSVGRIAVVLLPVPVFWALYDQINSSWVVQGARMRSFALFSYQVDAERIQSVSALLVLLWVPILTLWVYPLLERRRWAPTPLRRMGAGMLFTALSFVICAWLERRLEQGESLSLTWQLLPYVVLELGEVLVSATGLEFAYSQAPGSKKSFVMSLWLLTTSLGNFLVAAITALNSHFVHARGSTEFLFYAGLMVLVLGIFALLACRFQYVRHRPAT
jgi:POT family proton-dependent oligopeptide transporter